MTSCILSYNSLRNRVTAFFFSPYLYKSIIFWEGLKGLPYSMMHLDLNSCCLKYLSPDGIIVGTFPVFTTAPSAINAIPALKGNKSDWSWDPPSGNTAMHPSF